jgi:hypothetical protein
MASTLFNKPPAELVDLMKRAGSNQPEVAGPAQALFAKAISLPLNEALLAGDILGGLYQTVNLTNGEALEYPTDILNPGDEGDFIAYVCPDQGRIPERQVSGDYVALKTFKIANSIDVNLRLIRDANWDIFGRALEVMKAGFVMKMNVDGWNTLIASAESRGLEVYDSAATAGVFSRRLLSLMTLEMRRNGGRFTHLNRRKLTHLFMSPEAMEDIKFWTIADVDDITRRELFLVGDGKIPTLGGVSLVDLDEFGVGEVHNDYYIQTKGSGIGNSKVEIVIGADLGNSPFIMPIREELMIVNDPNMHRYQKAGFYGWMEAGYASLDNRYLLVGAL